MAKDTAIHHTAYPFKRICWSAIFSGALVAVGLSFLFNLFAVVIGLSAFTVGKDGAIAIALGGTIGIFIAVIVSMLVSGYAAGYLGRLYAPRRNLGILYGFLTWTLALVLSAVLVGHVTNYTTGYSHAIGNTTFKMSHHPEVTLETTVVTEDHAIQEKRDSNMTVSSESLVMGAFLIFVLFFVGAFSTCAGATWGMACSRED